MSVRPSVHPSIRPSVHPSVRPSIHPFIHPSASIRPCIGNVGALYRSFYFQDAVFVVVGIGINVLNEPSQTDTIPRKVRKIKTDL